MAGSTYISNMDSALDFILNGGWEEDAAYIEAIDKTREEVATLAVDGPFPDVDKEILVDDYDEATNILDERARKCLMEEVLFEEMQYFDRAISTTNTMEGYLSNVSFHEEQLIKRLVPTRDFLAFKCNFGDLYYPGYSTPVHKKTSNRGRKRKERVKKPRKYQGNGTAFNSQISFIMRAGSATEHSTGSADDAPPNEDTPVYKFKIFRTGKLQLPGAKCEQLEDVIRCARLIAALFKELSGESVRLININPVMKNYKFSVKLPPGHLLDLRVMRDIILADKETIDSGDETPPIFSAKYNRQDTKLSIKFKTPIRNNDDKRTRIKIFMRGRVNILGGLDTEMTRGICTYLHDIISVYSDDIIVREGGIRAPRRDNIAPLPDDEAAWMAEMFYAWPYRHVAPITEEELEDLWAAMCAEDTAKMIDGDMALIELIEAASAGEI